MANKSYRQNVKFSAFGAQFEGVFHGNVNGFAFELWNAEIDGQSFESAHALRQGSEFLASDEKIAFEAGIASGADYLGLCEDTNRGVN